MAKTLNQKALSAELSLSEARISALVRLPRFPRIKVGKRWFYDAAEVRAWLLIHAPGVRISEKVAVQAAAQATPTPTPLAEADNEFVRILKSGSATPSEIGNATLQLAARQIGTSALAGMIPAQQLDAVKKGMEEIRRSKESYHDFATREGLLIERTIATAVCGEMAARLNACFEKFANSLATQVELWFVDSAFAHTDTETRARLVRAWAEAQGVEIRRLEAAEIDRLIAAEIAGAAA